MFYKVFSKVCGVLSTLILLVLLALAVALVVPVLMGCTELAVLTGSMQPALPVGSLIYIKEADPAQLQVGDVITYRLEGDTMVTHRVVENLPEEGYLITQGDANQEPDGQITYDRVQGKMVFHLPWLGYISMNIRTKTGIFAVCGTLVVIILLTFLPEIFAPEEQEQEGAPRKKKRRGKAQPTDQGGGQSPADSEQANQ